MIALFCCCFTRTRKLLHSIDAFSSSHSDELDPQTNSGPKIVRKTGMGGFLTLIYAVFVICVAVSIFVQWKLNNITETKSLISREMDDTIDTTHIRLNTFRTQFILTDYQGYCVENSTSTTTKFGTCVSDITLNTTNLHFYGLSYTNYFIHIHFYSSLPLQIPTTMIFHHHLNANKKSPHTISVTLLTPTALFNSLHLEVHNFTSHNNLHTLPSL